MKQKRNTFFFIAGLLLLIMISFLLQNLFLKKRGANVIIEQHGQVIAELKLSENTVYEVEDPNGGRNTITIEDGSVFVSDANCPDRICVQTGKISTTGIPIACLPHGLIITIQDMTSDTDTQAY